MSLACSHVNFTAHKINPFLKTCPETVLRVKTLCPFVWIFTCICKFYFKLNSFYIFTGKKNYFQGNNPLLFLRKGWLRLTESVFTFELGSKLQSRAICIARLLSWWKFKLRCGCCSWFLLPAQHFAMPRHDQRRSPPGVCHQGSLMMNTQNTRW